MLKIISTLTILLFGWLAKAQVTDDRTISAFSNVEVQNGIELLYTESNISSLRVEAQNETTLNHVVTEIKGKTLHIYMTNAIEIASKEKVKVYLDAKNIESFDASSQSKIVLMNPLTASNCKIILNSGASFFGNIKSSGKTILLAAKGTEFQGRVDARTFKGNFRNTAKINLTGVAEIATIQTTDEALCSAKNFISKNIHLFATERSTIAIYAPDAITVAISDQAKVTYTGFPRKLAMNEDAETFSKVKCSQALSFNY